MWIYWVLPLILSGWWCHGDLLDVAVDGQWVELQDFLGVAIDVIWICWVVCY